MSELTTLTSLVSTADRLRNGSGIANVLLAAWNRVLPFDRLIEEAERLAGDGAAPLAIVLYRTWLSRNASPLAHAVEFNLGVLAANLGELSEAQQAYERAIAIAPGFVQPRVNLGLVFERLGQIDQAIGQWRWVVDRVDPKANDRSLVVMALNHLGRVFENRKSFREAHDFLSRSLALEPKQPDVVHHWVFLRQKQCIWPVYTHLPGLTEAQQREYTSALATIALSDDPVQQLEAAKQFVSRRFSPAPARLASHKAYGHERIRVGYCSSDFSLHPVSMLMVELFEVHDRARFEIFGFDWSPEDGSLLRARVQRAMDYFIPIGHLSDEAAARLIRDHEIDVLIDLQGQTAGARPNMLAWRPAPLQVTYLGQPATTGFPCIDYVIADRYLIPPEYAPFYSEKPLYMPDVYQVSDRHRASAAAPSRAECGLPEGVFVYCAFNNSYKYTQEMFEAWLRIIQRVPHSVLWLLADNEETQRNLREFALKSGVDPGRLVFAGRVAPENYLARYLTADLFLDTFPFNAGTTANDALWMGCPLLTLSGRSFASRMAGALLTAAGLPELITQDLAAYEEAAVALGQHPQRCQAFRSRLATVRSNGVLFDTIRFARHLEDRLIELVRA